MTTDRLVDDVLALYHLIRRASHPVHRAEMTPEQYWLLRLLRRRGALSIGEVAADAATPAPARTNGQPTLPGPEMGFDVPAGWSPDGRYLAVRTFQGNSAATPGSSALAVVGPNGFRTTLASREVTFLGWVSH